MSQKRRSPDGRLPHPKIRRARNYLRGLEWLLIEKLSQRLVCGDQDEPKLGIADDNSEPDEFWVDPDPSLFEK